MDYKNATSKMGITPLYGKIKNANELICMDILNLYSGEMAANHNKTYHEYISRLPPIVREQFNVIKNGTILRRLMFLSPDDVVDNIDDMNELYVSSIGALGSDRVFETEHLDGPMFFLPFCTVLRCVLAVQGNSSVVTAFPRARQSFVLNTHEFVAFDYNRDAHYIYKDSSFYDSNQRIILKIHYLITPKFVPRPIARFYSNAHVKYNQFMRYLFLRSQEKETALSRAINGGTVVYSFLYSNIHVVALAFGGLLIYMISK